MLVLNTFRGRGFSATRHASGHRPVRAERRHGGVGWVPTFGSPFPQNDGVAFNDRAD
jgi:hypothetical protein